MAETQEERRERERQEERAAKRREEALEAARERAREEEREREREEERRQEAIDRQREFEAAEQKSVERRTRYRERLRAERRTAARDHVREAQRQAARAGERTEAQRAESRTESAHADRAEARREEGRAQQRAAQSEEARAESTRAERAQARRDEGRAEQRAAGSADATRADARAESRAEARAASRADERAGTRRAETRAQQHAAEGADARRAETRAQSRDDARQEAQAAGRADQRRADVRAQSQANARQEAQAAERADTRRADVRAQSQANARQEAQAAERSDTRRADVRAQSQANARQEARAAERSDTRRADAQAEARATERAAARSAELRDESRAEARGAERAQERAGERAAVRREQDRADARAAQRRADADERRRVERAAEARRARRPPTRARPAQTDSGSLTRLRVRGRLLLDSRDQQVTLRGFTFRGLERPTPENGSFAPAVTDADIATLEEWGATAAVVPIAQDLALSGRDNAEPEDYLAAVDETVSALANAGVYTLVQLSLLSSTLPTGVDEHGDRFDPALPDSESLDLWALLARRYAATPSVVFDLFRAPHDPDEGDPLGALVSGLSWGLWRRWALAMLGHVRREHPGALAVVRGLDRGRDLSGFPLRFSDGSLPPNIVYGAGLAGDDTDDEVLIALAALGRTQSAGVLSWRADPERGTIVEAQGRRLARAGQHWIADDWMGPSAQVVQPIGRLGGPGILGVPRLVADAVLGAAPPCVVTAPFLPAELPAGPDLDSPYLPNPADLLNAAKAETPAERRQRIGDYLAEVKTRWKQAEGFGLIAVLDRVRSTEAKMKNSPVKPIVGLPQNTPTAFRELLMHDAKGTAETFRGRELVLETVKVADLSTAAETLRAIMNLRRLDEVLIRILAAHDAATVTGAPFEDVLALYRTEGDLGVPVEQASLSRGIPPGRADQSTHLGPLPDISHLVWIVRPEAFSPGCSDDVVREWALVQWMIQLVGLDDLGRSFKDFPDWSSANWRAAGLADAPANARTRWQGYRSLIDIERSRPSHSGASHALVGHVSDPLTLVAAILVEGIRFLVRLGQVESLVGNLDPADPLHGTRLTPGMTYLHYHAQRSGDDVGNSLPMPKFKGILLSGLVAASRAGSGAAHAPLRKAIRDVATMKKIVTDLQPTIAGLTPAQTISEAEAHWPDIAAWLRTGANLGLLSAFVESADSAVWTGWGELRGNMSRYNVQREYYRLLLAGP